MAALSSVEWLNTTAAPYAWQTLPNMMHVADKNMVGTPFP